MNNFSVCIMQYLINTIKNYCFSDIRIEPGNPTHGGTVESFKIVKETHQHLLDMMRIITVRVFGPNNLKQLNN